MPGKSAIPRKLVTAVLLTGVLIGGALAGFFWDATSSERPSAGPPPRGQPIRAASASNSGAAPAKSDAEGATPAQAPTRERDGIEYAELPLAVLTSYDYPRSGSFPGAPPAGTEPPSEAVASLLQADAPPAPRTAIPANVRAWDRKLVCVTGFMNPVEFDSDGVEAFLLTGVPGGCCFGMIPRLNDWVVVTMPEDERADYAYYDPVTIYGEISIGEEVDGGIVVSLYRMSPALVEIGD